MHVSWQVSELQRSLKEAKNSGVDVRALCVINPGNPTGNCLSKDNMKDVVRFCEANSLMLLADEVYQTNIYKDDKPFYAFKQIVAEYVSCC